MTVRLNKLFLSFALCCAAISPPVFADDETVGKRPYEMDWANRTEEIRVPVVDFENLDGWTVETTNSVATFERSREEQMYGQYVGKLTYRKGDGSEAPIVVARPPRPIPIAEKNIDALSCWVVGNNWAWAVDPATPQVGIHALLQNAQGEEISIFMETVNWREWFLSYKTISPELQARLGDAPSFSGIRVTGGNNVEDRTLYFDSFCAFKEELKPLEFKLRAKPGIDLFEGQPLGINAGEGRLPFPTNEDTILPDSAKNLFKPASHFYGDSCDFVYEGTDGTLVYKYVPKTGTWSDVTARWNDCEPIFPCANGGVRTLVGTDGQIEDVEKATLESLEQTDYGAKAIWTLASKSATAKVEYRFRIKGKSLIVDTIALGGVVPSVEVGKLDGIANPTVFTIPYYLYDYGRRPGVALFQPQNSDVNLFASAHIDWYRSGASYLSGKNGTDVYEKSALVGEMGAKKLVKQAVKYAVLNGSADYRTKTDGTRNDVYERFFFTISPDFAETLPTIANPKSPYRAVAGKGVWNAHGATTRDGDKKHWRNVWRQGMRRVIVTDHEVCWRDGGESFTFRTKPAPGKGGDEGWFDYCRFMQDELGFVYGPYNNFTDFAPVNEYWSPDMINRQQDGSLQHAWARCYAPKPTRAVEYCEKLTPINEEKFHFSCAYCDVHSSVPAWTRTDYDARVPGAGTFMSVFYPYGEIFLLQKQNWDGPTYSEGPHHCFYAGLTDGNYAQDQQYNLFKNPWLLDFDLLKIHDQEVDFGMGNIGMFAPGYHAKTPEEASNLIDRFVAAELAFGHSGYLALEYGMPLCVRAYFMAQQIASRYTQTSVESIRYVDAEGNLLDTSAALINDCVKRSQVCVKYQDGTVVVSNGSTTETLAATIDGRKVVLPPNGYTAWTADGQILVESFLSPSGARFDYCESPEYLYIDGRGTWIQRDKACGSGAGVCRILENGQFEIIPQNGAELGFKLADENEEITAVALDFDQNELGPATVRNSRGYAYVMPVEGAFSYLLTKTKKASAGQTRWTSGRFEVAPGETIEITDGTETRELKVPVDSALGRLWTEPSEGAWLDFQVVAPANVTFAYDAKSNELTVDVASNVPNLTVEGSVQLGGETLEIAATLNDAHDKTSVKRRFDAPTNVGQETASANFRFKYSQDAQRSETRELVFQTNSQFVPFSDYSFMSKSPEIDALVSLTPYVQLRGKEPSRDFGQTNATSYFAEGLPCGGVTKTCRFLHPPYGSGVRGRVFLRYDFVVPNEPTAFRMSAGRKDGSDLGDGIKFQIAVAKFDDVDRIVEDSEKTLSEQTVFEFKWVEMEADLSAYAGQKISLLVISDPGAKNDPSADWGCAADMRLESSNIELIRKLTETK